MSINYSMPILTKVQDSMIVFFCQNMLHFDKYKIKYILLMKIKSLPTSKSLMSIIRIFALVVKLLLLLFFVSHKCSFL
jgi:hypothetical protein